MISAVFLLRVVILFTSHHPHELLIALIVLSRGFLQRKVLNQLKRERKLLDVPGGSTHWVESRPGFPYVTLCIYMVQDTEEQFGRGGRMD